MKRVIILLALVFSVQLAVAQAPTRRCHVCQSFKKATEFPGESYTCKACAQKAASSSRRPNANVMQPRKILEAKVNKWKDAEPFSDGLARVADANGKWGFIDKTGKVVK